MIRKYYELENRVDWASLSDAQVDDVIRHRLAAYYARPSPKRDGYMIERIADMDNLRIADDEAQRGGKAKFNKHIREHNLHREEELRALQRRILTLNFEECTFREVEMVTDAGKSRKLGKKDYYPWKILDHAIIRQAWPAMLKAIIYDACACINGRGIHYGVRRMKGFLRRYPDLRWFWKTDYKKFYLGIMHEIVMNAFRKKFKDEHFLKLVELTICNYNSGEDIIKMIEDEKRKRIHNRGLSKSAYRELCTVRD